MNNLVLIAILSFVLSSFAHAQNHMGIKLQTYLKNPSGVPVNATNVTVRSEVLSANNCVLIQEVHTGVAIKDGYMEVSIGRGSRTSYDAGLSMVEAFDNSKARTGLNLAGTTNGTCNYTPTTGDRRTTRLTFNVGSDQLVIDFNMAAMPFAVQAENAAQLGGLDSSAYLRTNSSQGLIQANLEGLMNALVNNSGQAVVYNGSSFVPSALSSSADWSQITNKPTAFAPTAHGHYYSDLLNNPGAYLNYKPNNIACANGEVLKWNSSRWECAADKDTVVTSLDYSAITNKPSVFAPDLSMLGTLAQKNSVADAQVTDVNVSKITSSAGAYFTYQPNNVSCTDGQTLKWNSTNSRWECGSDNDSVTTALSWSQITSKPTTFAPSAHSHDASDIATGTLSVARGGTGLSALGSANTILGVNSAGNAAEYKTLTAGSGVTITNTAGNITITATGGSGGSVSNVTATAPLSVTNGSSTPNISIAQASGSSSGYLSSTDWTSFNSKLSSVSSSASLASGKLWIGDSSGKAQETALSGDITVTNAGVAALKSTGTAGTYVKVTTDAQGRVASGSNTLSATDIPSLDWSKITTGKPTTLAGYGITDAGSVSTVTATAPLQVANGSTAPALSLTSGSAAGQVLRWSGSAWAPSKLVISDLTNSFGSPAFSTGSCTAGTFITYSSVSDSFSCSAIAAGGDLSGNLPNPTVRAVQGVAVSATAPSTDQVLAYDGSKWSPTTLAKTLSKSVQHTTGTSIAGVAATLHTFSTSASATLNLPCGATVGTMVGARNNSAYNVTVSPCAGDTLESSGSIVLSTKGAMGVWMKAEAGAPASWVLVTSLQMGSVSCPAGMSMTGSAGATGTFCIDTNSQAVATIFNATLACEDRGMHLCDYKAWYKSCSRGSLPTTVGMTDGSKEWIDGSFIDTSHALSTGGSTCESRYSSNSDATTKLGYRCCLQRN